jgi:hypothetical protein
MGSSHNKMISKTSQRKTTDAVSEGEPISIKNEIDLRFLAFKSETLRILVLLMPCGSTELQKAFSCLVEKHIRNLKADLEAKKISPSLISLCTKRLVVQSHSIKIYFSYLNDMLSLQFAHDLKESLCRNSHLSIEEVQKAYLRKARGSFELQAFQELKSLLESKDSATLESTLGLQYEESIHKLNSLYSDVLNAEKVDSDLFEQIVGQALRNRCIGQSIDEEI